VPTHVSQLSRRERQIMDVLYRAGRATAADIRAGLPDPPSYSAVRALLRILEDKGHVRHEQDASRYVFIPTVKPGTAKRSALRHVINTFFEGSTAKVMAALVEMSGPTLDADELSRLRHLIDEAKQRQKQKE
jgi:BlaI family transcriptional regulator, penicillinase repressor